MLKSGGAATARAVVLGIFVSISAAFAACAGSIPYTDAPAAHYVYDSGEPLRIAVIDETGGDDWTPAINASIAQYGAASPYLDFGADAASANIVITIRRYSDNQPPALPGYVFQPGVGGFAAVYDVDGVACNYPPANVPVGCNGAIATANIYLNDIIPPGDDIEVRRERLILHEVGHALGLTRHSPDLGVAQLALRYGW